jgi:hypothetical protein
VADVVVSERWDCDLYPELEGLRREDMLLPESTKWFSKIIINIKIT